MEEKQTLKPESFQVPQVELNGNKYIIDPDLEQTQLLLQLVTSYNINIDTNESDEVVGQKLTHLLLALAKDGKLATAASYLFTPEGKEWSIDLAKEIEPNFKKFKAREAMGLIPSFFGVISGKSLG